MKELENAVKEAAKAMQQSLKAFGHDVSYSHCLEIASKQCGVNNWRAAKAVLAGHASPPVQKKPRVLVVVSGGVADPMWDDGVDVEVFDWDNYNDDPEGTGGVSAHFADLAEPLGIPVDGLIDCKHCGGPLDENGWCSDDTCIFSDYPQNTFTYEEYKVMSENNFDLMYRKYRRNRNSDDREPPAQSDVKSNHTEILQHNIEWFLRENGSNIAPTELDEYSVEHIERMIKEGYNQGELCVTGNDGDTEYFGWWSIK